MGAKSSYRLAILQRSKQMKLPVRRFRGSQRGQALVEFALMMPMALVLIMAIWEFGRGWNAYQVLTDAAREGARVSAVANANPAMTSDTVYNTINTRLFRAGLDSTWETASVTNFQSAIGDPTTVSISYRYQINYVGALLQWTTGEKNVILRTAFTMRNE